jgi:hypothetical protein
MGKRKEKIPAVDTLLSDAATYAEDAADALRDLRLVGTRDDLIATQRAALRVARAASDLALCLISQIERTR